MAETGYAVATLADLKAIPSTIRSQGYTKLVVALQSWFVFLSSDTSSADDINIVAPTSGTGRWFKTKSFTLSTDVINLSEFVQDALANCFTSTEFDITYNDPTNTLTITFKSASITNAHIASTAAIEISKIDGLTTALNNKAPTSHGHTISGITNFVPEVLSAIADNVTASSAVTYNTTTQELDFKSFIKVRLNGGTASDISTINFEGTGVNLAVVGSVATVTVVASSFTSVSYTISLLSVAGQTYTTTLTWPKAALLYELTGNFPARVRAYINATYAGADLSRTLTTELDGDHGCLLETVKAVPNWSVNCSPGVVLHRLPSDTTLAFNITNMDTVARTLDISFKTYTW